MMAVREIRTFPDPVLRKKAQRVEKIDGEIKNLVEDMVETMHAAPGVGLAAPQVGVSLRVFVADISVGEDPDALITLINPEIVSRSETNTIEEGCLSLPGVMSDVKRSDKVVVRGLNLQGEQVEIEAGGLMARVFQHEIDHLDGSLYWDHLGKIKRERLKKEYKNIRSQM
jgi:peptide deformylase